MSLKRQELEAAGARGLEAAGAAGARGRGELAAAAWQQVRAKLYYTSSLGSNWENTIIYWDQSQINWDQLDPSQDRTIPNPDHPPLWICLICR